mgnify:CR=1 FL=1
MTWPPIFSATTNNRSGTRSRSENPHTSRCKSTQALSGPAKAPAAAHAGHATQWDYAGAGGPERWAALKPEFAQCAGGTRQSPIDIRGGIGVDLEPIRFDYRPKVHQPLIEGYYTPGTPLRGRCLYPFLNAVETLDYLNELHKFSPEASTYNWGELMSTYFTEKAASSYYVGSRLLDQTIANNPKIADATVPFELTVAVP